MCLASSAVMNTTQSVARLAVFDDHLAFAESLGLVLSMPDDLVVVEVADAVPDPGELLSRHPLDLIVCDQNLGKGSDGISFVKKLREVNNDLPVVLLTAYGSPGLRAEVASLPNLHYLSKATPVRAVVAAVRSVLAGLPIGEKEPDNSGPKLRQRELDVLERLGRGMRAADIAEDLGISLHTVRDHIKSVLVALDASSQLEAVLNAQRLGLIEPPI